MTKLELWSSKSVWLAGAMLAGLIATTLASGGKTQPQAGNPEEPQVTYAAQGWTAQDRKTFYRTVQGSRIMPYAWFKALRRLDTDAPFTGDQLQRYGYLRDDAPDNTEHLPVGFVVDTSAQPDQIGMTCAACHTGQIEYQQNGVTKALRVDGAPADTDFQLFLTDLGAAARATLADNTRFEPFARAVLGERDTPEAAGALRADLAAWVKQFDDIVGPSLPTDAPWGPGRLDAFRMIFNRIAGRGLGVPSNMLRADAPVSYPFLWDARRQDRTQWNGSVPNGLFVLALVRNSGEVMGVFGDFKPYAISEAGPLVPRIIGYNHNSIDFEGLQTLEEELSTLKPPPWPSEVFGFNQRLADAGKPLFKAYCASCHAEAPSKMVPGTWHTPVDAVGTDPRTAVNAGGTSRTGVLEGALSMRTYAGTLAMRAPIGDRFGPTSLTADIAQTTVVGALLDHAIRPPFGEANAIQRALKKDHLVVSVDTAHGVPSVAAVGDALRRTALVRARMTRLYAKPPQTGAGAAYESRVLHGVWATAPYLHNGSVPNLWQLLTPPAQRQSTFMVGSRQYDPVNVGFVTDRSPSRYGRFVADPARGNGNGGHDYGTHLSTAQRLALIEYLKSL